MKRKAMLVGPCDGRQPVTRLAMFSQAEWDEETVAYFRQLTESDPLSVKVINVRGNIAIDDNINNIDNNFAIVYVI